MIPAMSMAEPVRCGRSDVSRCWPNRDGESLPVVGPRPLGRRRGLLRSLFVCFERQDGHLFSNPPGSFCRERVSNTSSKIAFRLTPLQVLHYAAHQVVSSLFSYLPSSWPPPRLPPSPITSVRTRTMPTATSTPLLRPSSIPRPPTTVPTPIYPSLLSSTL